MRRPVALVTASTRGLGYATAVALLQRGYMVTISSRTQAAVTRAISALPEDLRPQALDLPMDVSDAAAIDQGCARVIQLSGGRIDTLVINAGGPPPGLFVNLDEESWHQAYELTLMSSVRLIRSVLPAMREHGGHILAITSSSVRRPIDGLLLSNVFRAGVTAMLKTLSVELAPHGILVNALAPGSFDTDRLRQLASARAQREGLSVDAVRTQSASGVPLGRLGRPEEFGRAAAFLASSENTYITGQTLLIDGGALRSL